MVERYRSLQEPEAEVEGMLSDTIRGWRETADELPFDLQDPEDPGADIVAEEEL